MAVVLPVHRVAVVAEDHRSRVAVVVEGVHQIPEEEVEVEDHHRLHHHRAGVEEEVVQLLPRHSQLRLLLQGVVVVAADLQGVDIKINTSTRTTTGHTSFASFTPSSVGPPGGGGGAPPTATGTSLITSLITSTGTSLITSFTIISGSGGGLQTSTSEHGQHKMGRKSCANTGPSFAAIQ